MVEIENKYGRCGKEGKRMDGEGRRFGGGSMVRRGSERGFRTIVNLEASLRRNWFYEIGFVLAGYIPAATANAKLCLADGETANTGR